MPLKALVFGGTYVTLIEQSVIALLLQYSGVSLLRRTQNSHFLL